jgi:hypothetical protein
MSKQVESTESFGSKFEDALMTGVKGVVQVMVWLERKT